MKNSAIDVPTELILLLCDLTDGEITDNELERLSAWLVADPALVHYYVMWMQLQLDLPLELQHFRHAPVPEDQRVRNGTE